MTKHPSDEKLRAWLESGRPGRASRHLDSCAACLERLDALSGLDGGLRNELDSASVPPTDLVDRTLHGVRDRLVAEDALALVVELFGLPWQVAQALDPAPLARRVTESAVSASDESHDNGERSNG